MKIIYLSDEAAPAAMELDELVANFNESTSGFRTAHSGWVYRCNEADMRAELASRGWYEGQHENGMYLVLNREILPDGAGLMRDPG